MGQVLPLEPDAASNPEEEHWAAVQGSCSRARQISRDALFERYAPIARRLAWRFKRDDALGTVEISELVQLASLGLIEAIDHYRPELGVPFRYYCPRRISGAIADGLAIHSEVRQQLSAARRIRRDRARSLSADRQVGASLADKLDFIGDIAAELTIGLMLEDSALFIAGEGGEGPSAFESVAWQQTRRQLLVVLASLEPREREIVTLHYADGLRFDQIAELKGLSKGRISQLHKEALSRMRKRLTASGLLRIEV
jgi:RNA polymerase sigma factor for flagellar operon FliA